MMRIFNLIDRPRRKARFLVLGSASPQLMASVSESLAGRIGFVELEGFLLDEVGAGKRDRVWLRGGLPRAFFHVAAAFRTRETYFWATHAGAELDLFVPVRGKRYGFECKFQDAPGMTRSMHAALSDLSLDHLWVVYPGPSRYEIHGKVTAIPLSEVMGLATSLAQGRLPRARPAVATRADGGRLWP